MLYSEIMSYLFAIKTSFLLQNDCDLKKYLIPFSSEESALQTISVTLKRLHGADVYSP